MRVPDLAVMREISLSPLAASFPGLDIDVRALPPSLSVTYPIRALDNSD